MWCTKQTPVASFTIQQKQEYARLLFCFQGLNQKETAKRVGVTPKTMCDWVERFSWEDLKASFTISKEQELRRIYAQINELNNAILERPQGKRYANNKEADTLVKLTAAARSLESEASIADTISVFMKFNEWLRKVDLPKSQQWIDLQDAFIKTTLSK